MVLSIRKLDLLSANATVSVAGVKCVALGASNTMEEIRQRMMLSPQQKHAVIHLDDHGVHETRGTWIIRCAGSAAVARDLERYFVDVIGVARGDAATAARVADHAAPCRAAGETARYDGWSVGPAMVYAYRRGIHTRP